MKKHIVHGSFILEEGVGSAEEFYVAHKNIIDSIVDWANNYKFYAAFGTSDDNSYLCEYEFEGATKQYIKGLISELKTKLKVEFKHIRIGYQIFGEKVI